MKKFEELSKEEKKEVNNEFKKSKFNKYISLAREEGYLTLIFCVLSSSTDLLDFLYKFGKVVYYMPLFLLFAFYLYVYFKGRNLVKEYYNLIINN